MTEFLRESGSVLSLAEQGQDILVRRRDGPDLVLRLASREEGLRRVLKTAASLIGAAMHAPKARQQMLDRPADTLPWLAPLPADDRVHYIEEFVQELAAAVDTGDVTPLLRLRETWETQADLHKYPELAKRLSEAADADEAYLKHPHPVAANQNPVVTS